MADTIGRVPPHNNDAEVALLGAVLLRNRALEEVQSMLDQASDIIEGADDIRTMLNNFTTELETLQTTINNKYTLPSGGIPKTDLSSSVQASLEKAENAQPKESGKGLSTNDYSDAEKAKLAQQASTGGSK